MIDNTTVPRCEVRTQYFDWGEPYQVFIPLFDFSCIEGETQLEKSVVFFGKNNFKNQILFLYNLVLNYEEHKISNIDEPLNDRMKILKLLDSYSKFNASLLSPWEKYSDSLNERDYMPQVRNKLDFELCHYNENIT